MATEKKAAKKNNTPGVSFQKTVTKQLEMSLTALKEKLGEKEFKKRIKKTAKKLVAGINKISRKKQLKKIIPVKKKTAKPAKKK